MQFQNACRVTNTDEDATVVDAQDIFFCARFEFTYYLGPSTSGTWRKLLLLGLPDPVRPAAFPWRVGTARARISATGT